MYCMHVKIMFDLENNREIQSEIEIDNEFRKWINSNSYYWNDMTFYEHDVHLSVAVVQYIWINIKWCMFNHVVRPLVSHCHRYYWFPLQLTSNKYQFKTIVHLYQPVLFFRFNSFAQTNTNSCLYAHSHTLFPLYSRDKIVARVARLIFYDHWYAGHSPNTNFGVSGNSFIRCLNCKSNVRNRN